MTAPLNIRKIRAACHAVLTKTAHGSGVGLETYVGGRAFFFGLRRVCFVRHCVNCRQTRVRLAFTLYGWGRNEFGREHVLSVWECQGVCGVHLTPSRHSGLFFKARLIHPCMTVTRDSRRYVFIYILFTRGEVPHDGVGVAGTSYSNIRRAK